MSAGAFWAGGEEPVRCDVFPDGACGGMDPSDMDFATPDGAGGPRMPATLFDMHFHLDFCADPVAFARDAAGLGIGVFANTVIPSGFAGCLDALEGAGNVRLGVGMHPRWIDPETIEVELARYRELACGRRFFGEVGLDFGKRHIGTAAAQVTVFQEICRMAARANDSADDAGAVISIHAIRSTAQVLDILEETGAAGSATCILHWFSGSSDELSRARSMGCMFSVNRMMAASRRGREYIRQIPSDRLLLETDAPSEEGGRLYSARDLESDLREVLAAVCEIKGEDLSDRIASASAALLGI